MNYQYMIACALRHELDACFRVNQY